MTPALLLLLACRSEPAPIAECDSYAAAYERCGLAWIGDAGAASHRDALALRQQVRANLDADAGSREQMRVACQLGQAHLGRDCPASREKGGGR